MVATSREELTEALDHIEAGVDELLGLSFDVLTTPERFAVLERIESVTRRLPVPGHALINEIRRQATPIELGGRLSHALASRLRITRADAQRRIDEAIDLGWRCGLTGEPLAPELEATAAAQRAGAIGRDHVTVIRRFYHRLPAWVGTPARAKAEAELAQRSTEFRPEQVAGLADRLTDILNPDGTYRDEDRARRRWLTLGKQQADGMSQLTGYISPRLRATVEAVLAKTAAPGMCNSERPDPVLDGSPSQEAIDSDTRSAGQRNHDGLLAALDALLAAGKLGQHNGLPASVIVTAELADLEAAAGCGRTGGGTRLPMSDVIRLAGRAHRYLAIFDKGKPLALYHAKRLANPAQRLMLYARERGCSHPDCDVAGYYCEVHHDEPYAQTGVTDIHDLTFRCHPHHEIITSGGWKTRKNHRGDTETLAPPHLDHGQPRINRFHHPEKLLRDNEDDDDGDGP